MKKEISNTTQKNKARRILASLRNKERACKTKMQKIGLRIKLLEEFVSETKGKKITLAEWLGQKGYDSGVLFPSMGYYTPIGKSVSYDKENRDLNYMKGMVRNPAIKGYVPEPNVVGSANHKSITKSKLGMTFDPALNLYFPTTIFDTDLYASAEGQGEDVMDMVGFYSSEDISRFSAFNDDSEDVVDNLIELYEEEYDNVEGELDTIYAVQEKLGYTEDFSNASAGKNATCRFGCNFKRKSKRAGCFSDCDKKHPPSQKQEERREKQSDRRTERKENREERKDARQDKRKAIKDCKAEVKSGNISKKDLKSCKKEQKKIKKDRIKEAGGSFLARVGRGFAKVFPLTASARGGILILAKMNAFGFSTRVAPSILPEGESKKLFKGSAIKNGKKAWKKIQNAFRNLGGNPKKLEEAILEGYKKKATKVGKKSSADGYTKFTVSEFSNIDPATATLIGTGITALVSLIAILVQNKVPKDPYLDGEAPDDWNNSKSAVDEVPPLDPNEPQLDPNTGEWIDPATGKVIDPLTGAYKGEIFGMNQYLFYGLLGVGAVGLILVIRKMTSK